ncbi:MAG: DUF305 domain-containing protein [Devosia sp.]
MHNHSAHDAGAKQQEHHGRHAYLLFALNMLLSFVAMYFLMFTMVDTWGDFYNNLNMGFMAVTMLAPMGILMLLLMRGMYGNRRLNLVLYAGFTLLFVLALVGIRTQTPIGNDQFIASMIPHHSGAILMCREANITDAELRALCDGIQLGQRQEIEQMKTILTRLQSSSAP